MSKIFDDIMSHLAQFFGPSNLFTPPSDIKLKNNKFIQAPTINDTNYSILGISSNNNLYLGSSTWANSNCDTIINSGKDTYVQGNSEVKIRTNATNTTYTFDTSGRLYLGTSYIAPTAAQHAAPKQYVDEFYTYYNATETEGWSWIKFRNGHFIAWRYASYTFTTDTATGSLHYSEYVNWSLPFTIKSGVPSIKCTTMLTWPVNVGITTTQIGCRIMRASAIPTSTANGLYFIVVGTY